MHHIIRRMVCFPILLLAPIIYPVVWMYAGHNEATELCVDVWRMYWHGAE